MWIWDKKLIYSGPDKGRFFESERRWRRMASNMKWQYRIWNTRSFLTLRLLVGNLGGKRSRIINTGFISTSTRRIRSVPNTG